MPHVCVAVVRSIKTVVAGKRNEKEPRTLDITPGQLAVYKRMSARSAAFTAV